MSNVPHRSCGSCSFCCKVMGIASLQKPAGKWCDHAKPGKGGCAIYADRPSECKEFHCIWVLSPKNMPEWQRPDKLHAMFAQYEGQEHILFVYVDPSYPNAFREHPLQTVIDHLAKGYKILLCVGDRVYTRLGKQWIKCSVVKQGDGISGRLDAYIDKAELERVHNQNITVEIK